MPLRIHAPLAIPLLAFALAACQPPSAAVVEDEAPTASHATTNHVASAHADHADTGHDHHGGGEPPTFPDTPWASDQPLRDGMDGIAKAYMQARAAQARGAFDADQAAALVATVQERTAYMFAHCELPDDADAALHVLLAHLAEGAQRSTSDASADAGLDHMGRTLALYPRYFTHDAWPLAAPH